MIAATMDPDGRRVVLTNKRWLYIPTRHKELSRFLGEVMPAVREPDLRAAGHRPREELFLIQWTGLGPWLQVVVHYEGGQGRLVTAFRLEAR